MLISSNPFSLKLKIQLDLLYTLTYTGLEIQNEAFTTKEMISIFTLLIFHLYLATFRSLCFSS
jgi:hypothetical protein